VTRLLAALFAIAVITPLPSPRLLNTALCPTVEWRQDAEPARK
jgi:hypothetical protein